MTIVTILLSILGSMELVRRVLKLTRGASLSTKVNFAKAVKRSLDANRRN